LKIKDLQKIRNCVEQRVEISVAIILIRKDIL